MVGGVVGGDAVKMRGWRGRGGKERMRRLLNVVASGRVDLAPLVTHHYALDDITNAYELFANQRDGVLKVAIKP